MSEQIDTAEPSCPDIGSTEKKLLKSAPSRHSTLLVRLGQPVAIDGLVVFRIAFGLSVAWFAIKFLGSRALAHDYIEPPFHLTYYGFGWVRPWPGDGMYLHFLALAGSALAVATGFYYRVSSIIMFLAFTQVFLCERALYNNHYYLISLLSLLICFMPLHRAFSLDALRRAVSAQTTTPRWTLWVLRFQLGVVYFYGGIAKLNGDWLQGQPMRMWLAAETDFPLIGHFFAEGWMVQIFVWGGILIDLLAVPLLLHRRTLCLDVHRSAAVSFDEFAAVSHRRFSLADDGGDHHFLRSALASETSLVTRNSVQQSNNALPNQCAVSGIIWCAGSVLFPAGHYTT